ncbi:kinase-like protein [Basidiobolus meristosporus CBS 931.73]|uniref:non-specific serine/threonine protein kinase n=1 Tax=Basidiobolus meristosporus CBS 931.73 TaxID=1314790 RepID=A0A1Y1Y849_9FUNG|nr:kinase-like protein [Basidiobolus meristosporus CBS 931.73]|eukprot:ORX94187.1 kinase-like protein [Basidiobolus meristosporus CBS 931.73]
MLCWVPVFSQAIVLLGLIGSGDLLDVDIPGLDKPLQDPLFSQVNLGWTDSPLSQPPHLYGDSNPIDQLLLQPNSLSLNPQQQSRRARSILEEFDEESTKLWNDLSSRERRLMVKILEKNPGGNLGSDWEQKLAMQLKDHPEEFGLDDSEDSDNTLDVDGTMNEIYENVGRFLPGCISEEFETVTENICTQKYCRRAIERMRHRDSGKEFIKKRFNVTDKEEMHCYHMEMEIMYTLLAAKETSPYIAGMWCHGQEDDGIPFVFYEYLAGEDISRTNAFRGLSNGQLRKLVAQFVQAVDDFHTITGAVHGDIKPNNLMFTDRVHRDHIKLIDYGGVQPIHGDLWSDVIVFNEVATAPEVYTDDYQHPRTSADWFSVGATVYWMYMQAYAANNPQSVAAQGDDFAPFFIETKSDQSVYEIPKKYPPYFEPELIDFLEHLLIFDVQRRLNITSIKEQPLFRNIDWNAIAYSPHPTFLTNTNAGEDPYQLPACYPWEKKFYLDPSLNSCLQTYEYTPSHVNKTADRQLDDALSSIDRKLGEIFEQKLETGSDYLVKSGAVSRIFNTLQKFLF